MSFTWKSMEKGVLVRIQSGRNLIVQTLIVCAALTATIVGPTAAQVSCTSRVPGNPCVPGGGSSSTDCYLEWYVKGTRGPLSPKLNAQGIPQNLHICFEGDKIGRAHV